MLRLLGALRDCSRYVQRGVRDHPLDAIDVGILALTQQGEGQLRPSQAVERLEVPFPSVTRHVRRLHRDGYVSIQPATDDRRSYVITETESGRQLLHEFQDHLVTRFAPVLEGWDSADIRALADGLNRLDRSMNAATQRRVDRPNVATWWRETDHGQLNTEGQQS